jgi:hypothetical protein
MAVHLSWRAARALEVTSKGPKVGSWAELSQWHTGTSGRARETGVGTLRAQGSKIQLNKKRDRSGQTADLQLGRRKIQLYSFLDAITAAYVRSICS